MNCDQCGQPTDGDGVYCDNCGAAMDGAPESGDNFDDMGATPVSAFLGVLEPGSMVGHYQILGELGEGGMGKVYHARHIDDLSEVALKVLAPHLVRKPSILARFKQEATLQKKLQHTHVVRVYELLEEDPIYAIVMEYVEGVTLEQMIHEHTGPMVPSRCKAVMLPVLAAVGYAHTQGVVHRDLKPSNIMLTTVDGRETAKVTDFGIAKALSGGGGVETVDGSKLGTVWYMAPEQCKSSKDVDARSDIYSLGVTLYEMATGKVPFSGDSEFEVMLSHIEVPPQPPSSHYPGVEPALEEVILTAMEKQRGERFNRAQDFAGKLRAVPDEPGGWLNTGSQPRVDESGVQEDSDPRPTEEVSEISSGSFTESSGSMPPPPAPPKPPAPAPPKPPVPAPPKPPAPTPPKPPHPLPPSPPAPAPPRVKTPSVPVDPVTGEPEAPLVLPARLIVLAAGGAALVTLVAFLSVWMKSC